MNFDFNKLLMVFLSLFLLLASFAIFYVYFLPGFKSGNVEIFPNNNLEYQNSKDELLTCTKANGKECEICIGRFIETKDIKKCCLGSCQKDLKTRQNKNKFFSKIEINVDKKTEKSPLTVTFFTNEVFKEVKWDVLGKIIEGKNEITYTFNKPGSYFVSLEGISVNGRNVKGVSNIVVTYPKVKMCNKVKELELTAFSFPIFLSKNEILVTRMGEGTYIVNPDKIEFDNKILSYPVMRTSKNKDNLAIIQESEFSKFEVKLYNLKTKEEREIYKSDNLIHEIGSNENFVIWVETIDHHSTIKAFNLTNNQLTTISDTNNLKRNLFVVNNFVYWHESTIGMPIKEYNFLTGKSINLVERVNPGFFINENELFFIKYQEKEFFEKGDSDVFYLNLDTLEEKQLTFDYLAHENVWKVGSKIVWTTERDEGTSLYLTDYNDNREELLEEKIVGKPFSFENRLAWVNDIGTIVICDLE